MAHLLYVRGAAGNVAVADLGITVAQGPGWTQLLASSPGDADGSSGQFTAREIRDSADLTALINAGTIEWSRDAVSVAGQAEYVADFVLMQDFTDDLLDLNDGRLAIPTGTTLPASGVEGEVYWDSDDEGLWIYDEHAAGGAGDWLLIATASGIANNHGNLEGLEDDDHLQYLLLGGDYVRNQLTGDVALTSTGSIDATSGIFTLPTADDVAGTFTSGGEGDIAWDSDDDMLYLHDGSVWRPLNEVLSGVLDHNWLLNIGNYSHTTIDSHIDNGTIHGPYPAPDHGTLPGLGDDDHTQYALLSGDEARNIFTGAATFASASGLVIPVATDRTGLLAIEGNLMWDSDDDALWMYDGVQWVTVATASGVNNDHGGLTGLEDDDHTQYLTLSGDNARNAVTGAIDMSGGTQFTLPQAADVPGTLTGKEGSMAWDTDDEILWAHDGTQWFQIAPASGIITDHGSLTGRDDDDHTQYVLLDGDLTRNTFTDGGIDLASASGLIVPTGVDRTGLAEVEGNIMWDTDNDQPWFYDGTQWRSVPMLLSGVLDHGTLEGLADDDHPQYTDWSHDEVISGVWKFDPADTDPNLILDPRDSAPTNNLVDGAIATVSGLVYSYDGSRSKWLSIDRNMYTAARRGNATDIYMRVTDALASSVTGYRVLRDGTITGLFAQTEGAESWTFEVRRGGSVIASLVISAADGGQATDTNVDVSAGDELQFYCNGTQISNPVGGCEIAWRVA